MCEKRRRAALVVETSTVKLLASHVHETEPREVRRTTRRQNGMVSASKRSCRQGGRQIYGNFITELADQLEGK